MSSGTFAHERVAELIAQHRNSQTGEEKEATLAQLIELYDELKDTDKTGAEEARQAFVLALTETPDISDETKLTTFLSEHIQSEDFAKIEWRDPDHVITFCEHLYGFRSQDEQTADQLREHVTDVLSHALQRFERQGELEKMFQLLRLSPETATHKNAEMFRMRNRAYLYEVRRVERHRQVLFAYLALHAFLVVLAFPLLFVYSENGALQDKVEEMTKVEIGEPQRRYFSYADALYWSLITTITIGYGDITPQTATGRAIAVANGLLGTLTTGVIAGLILRWITPRILDL